MANLDSIRIWIDAPDEEGRSVLPSIQKSINTAAEISGNTLAANIQNLVKIFCSAFNDQEMRGLPYEVQTIELNLAVNAEVALNSLGNYRRL